MAFVAISARHENLVWDAASKGQIGHFRVQLSLYFKTRLSAKSLLWKSVFIHIEIATNYRNKNFALGLALKERLMGTRKWPITIPRVNVWLLHQGGTPVLLGSKPLGANEATHRLLNRSIKEERCITLVIQSNRKGINVGSSVLDVLVSGSYRVWTSFAQTKAHYYVF